MTAKQIREYEEAFHVFDTDGSGGISRQELTEALQKLGQELSKREMDAIFRDVDADAGGSISLAEFVATMNRRMRKMHGHIRKFKRSFRMFDTDGSGEITRDELENVMRGCGRNPTEEQLDDMMGDLDADGSGSIEFEEFIDMMVAKMLAEKEARGEESSDEEESSSDEDSKEEDPVFKKETPKQPATEIPVRKVFIERCGQRRVHASMHA